VGDVSPTGRSLWAALHLLDRQVLDRDGLPTAKVDDLELTLPDDPEGVPVLTAILCGQAALARRFDRRLGAALERLRRVVDPRPDPGPARIDWTHVREVRTHVTVSVSRDDLDVTVVDRWLAAAVLSHVPGSGIERGDG
jgi:hypothetical protein